MKKHTAAVALLSLTIVSAHSLAAVSAEEAKELEETSLTRQVEALKLEMDGKKVGKVGQPQTPVMDDPKVRQALITAIADRCTEVESGARNVDHILTRTLLPELSTEFLSRMAAGERM